MIPIGSSPLSNVIIGIIAIAVLILSAEKLVEKVLRISRHLRIPELFLGITVISIGTSFAELITTVVAGTEIMRGELDYHIGSGAILGTNVGSDFVQLTLITGIVALFGVIRARKDFLKSTFLVMIGVESLVFLFCLDGVVSRVEGFVLFFGYIVYLYVLYMNMRDQKMRKKAESANMFIEVPLVVVGFAALVLAAEVMLRVSVYFVDYLSIGGSLIGVLVIGVATALPEFTTAMTAMLKKSPQISLGTLIGSNITNPAMVVGTGAMISTLAAPRPVVYFDFPVTILSALVILSFFWRKGELGKREAIFMIALYILYAILRIKFFHVD